MKYVFFESRNNVRQKSSKNIKRYVFSITYENPDNEYGEGFDEFYFQVDSNGEDIQKIGVKDGDGNGLEVEGVIKNGKFTGKYRVKDYGNRWVKVRNVKVQSNGEIVLPLM